MSTEQELKPLPFPFCGKEPKLISGEYDYSWCRVRCETKGCAIGYLSPDDSPYLQFWNIRSESSIKDQSKEIEYLELKNYELETEMRILLKLAESNCSLESIAKIARECLAKLKE